MITTLIESLDDRDLEKRNQAEQQLAALGSEAVEPLIATMLGGQGPKSWISAKLLAKIDDERRVPALIQALESPNPIVRQIAADLLGGLGDQRAIEPLLARLDDGKILVKLWAVTSLGKLRAVRAFDPLCRLLENADSSTLCYTVIEALGNLGDPRAIRYILPYQEDEDRHIQTRAHDALKKLNYQPGSNA